MRRIIIVLSMALAPLALAAAPAAAGTTKPAYNPPAPVFSVFSNCTPDDPSVHDDLVVANNSQLPVQVLAIDLRLQQARWFDVEAASTQVADFRADSYYEPAGTMVVIYRYPHGRLHVVLLPIPEWQCAMPVGIF